MKFYKYTPALLDPKTLEDTLIGRDIELNNIKRILKSASAGKSLSHAILIGPKGIGKTHVLRIIYYAIKGELKTKGLNAYKEKFIPVIFSEEEYPGNITKLIKLTLQYLRESETGTIPPVPDELMKAIILGSKEKELAFDYVEMFKEKTGKILLLLIDNLNNIIERFTDEDQSSLREVLMTYDSVLLIGTAPTLFDSIINHDKPLYNFFEIIWLKDLPFEETVELLNKYAKLEGRNDLIEKFKESEPKLKAIHELTGGNPRLILSLYHVIVEGDISSVEDTFLKILDELSPYFREKMKDLSEQQQEIIDVMARAESLLTPTEIARFCQMLVNVVNAQLKRLEKIGYVKKYAEKPKRVLYDLNEKLFSLWRQMRIEAGRKRLGFIVRFLEIWFTKEELFTYLDKTLDSIREKLPVDYSEIQYDIDKLWYLEEAIPEFKGDDEICVACQREDYDVALEIINKALKNNPNNVKKQYQQGCIYIRLKQYAKAIEAHKKVIELKPDKHEAWCELGISYNHLKRYEEAIEAYKKAIEIKPDEHGAWYNMGNSYENLKRYEEAIEAYKKAIEIKPDKHEAWNNMGNSYENLKRYEEAIEAYKKAIEIKPDEHQPWCNLGSIYRRLKKYSDALKILTEAIKLKPDCDFTLNNLLGIYKIIYLNEGIKGNIGSASKNLKGLLNLVGYTSKKDRIYDFLIASLKKMIANKKIDLIKTTLTEIEETKQIDLLRLLSPYSTFIKYLETKDKEIIDRLRHEERIVVEDMLRMIEEDKSERKVKKAVQEETK